MDHGAATAGTRTEDGRHRAPQDVAAALRAAVASTLRGKPVVVDLALATLLGGGHLLVEDLPGTGKTLLAKSIAGAIGGRFGRVQCTPDLLPTDITGTSVFRPDSGEWTFRPGPVFANVVLVDEVNRASPRTQSALLEPMEERQVTVDGTTWTLPDPFFCIATQNPFGQVGTFPLPESQLDRFALAISLGLPDRDAEREIITGIGGVDVLASLHPVSTPDEISSCDRGNRRDALRPQGRGVRAGPDRGDTRRGQAQPGRLAPRLVGPGAPCSGSRRGRRT